MFLKKSIQTVMACWAVPFPKGMTMERNITDE